MAEQPILAPRVEVGPTPTEAAGQGIKAGILGFGKLPLLAAIPFVDDSQEMFKKYDELFGIKGEPTKEQFVYTDPQGNEQFDENAYLKAKGAYLAGEGAGSGGLFGLASKGIVNKLARTGINITENAATNFAVGMATDDPIMRVMLGVPAGVVVGGQKILKDRFASKLESAQIDPETGVPITAFQTEPGKAEVGATELNLRLNPKTADTANFFDLSQNKTIENFLGNMQKFVKSPIRNMDEITDGVFQAYKNYNNALVTKLKEDGRNLFNAAREAGANPNIQLNSTRNTIEELLATIDKSAPGAAENIADFKKILAEYPDASTVFTTVKNPLTLQFEQVAQPLAAKGIDINKLQQQLAAWSDAASTGTYRTVDNALVGVSKGQARRVLNSLQEDLTRAIQEGVPGAAELKKARDTFRENVVALQKFNDKPLTKYFAKENIESLTPEKVVDKLTKIEPSERADLLAVLSNSDSALADGVRQQAFQNIWNKVFTEFPTSGKGNVDLNKALIEFRKLPKEDVRYLFPTKQEQKEFYSALSILQKASKDPRLAGFGNEMRELGRDVSLTAGTTFGARARYASQAAWDFVKRIVELPPEQQAIVIFNPNGRKALQEFQKGNFSAANALWNGIGLMAPTQAISGANLQSGQRQEQEMKQDRQEQIKEILRLNSGRFQPEEEIQQNVDDARKKQIEEILKINNML